MNWIDQRSPKVKILCACFVRFCVFALGLEMWGVLAWSWSATRDASSAAYRPSVFRYCTNRRRVFMYEVAPEHNLGWTDRRTRGKWGLDPRTDSLQPASGSQPLVQEVIGQTPQVSLTPTRLFPSIPHPPSATTAWWTSRTGPGLYLGECNAFLQQRYFVCGATIPRDVDLQT